MNNKHIPTEMRHSGVSIVTLNRTEVHNCFITELSVIVTDNITRRISSQQATEKALLQRDPG